MWNLQNGIIEKKISLPESSIGSICVTKDSKNAIIGLWNGDIYLYNISDGKEIKKFAGHKDVVFSLEILDENRFISASWDQVIILWDIKSGQKFKEFKGHRDIINVLTITNDRKHIISGSNDNTIKFWDIKTGKEIFDKLDSKVNFSDFKTVVNYYA